ncbi:MAG: phosphate ABC transporter, permease protein PstA [Chloroflexi bacterium HGW-Chloroflexi-7]|nr:MAG: phosphate ABC transporter, permease protein PstA [Chloroflexi bacterium HGW-Chloroflexi-7]
MRNPVNLISSISYGRDQHLENRQKKASIWKALFRLSTLVGVIALVILILSIVNQAFGLVAIEDTNDRSDYISTSIKEVPKTELIQLIETNLSKNRVRTLDREKPLLERSRRDLIALVENEVFKQRIVDSYSLFSSIFNPDAFREKVAEKYPDAIVEFKSWFTPQFLTESMSKTPELAGVRTALLGSILLILITVVVAFPLGVSSAIYLEEYARQNTWLSRVIQTNIDNLAGVPSIIYGILGLTIFVRAFEPLTSGRVFGYEGANGRTILSAGLTMALLVLPILITNAQEAIRAVPNSLRQASYGLGATQWQTIWHHVLPYALPGILTGTILAISRALGETAPLIIVGAATYITKDPNGLFSNFTAIPIQIYNWTTRPQQEFRNIAAVAILVLMIMLLSMNAVAILWRNKIQNKR